MTKPKAKIVPVAPVKAEDTAQEIILDKVAKADESAEATESATETAPEAEKATEADPKLDRLKEVFASHNVNRVFRTADGNVFIQEQYALMHAESLGGVISYESIPRSEVE